MKIIKISLFLIFVSIYKFDGDGDKKPETKTTE